MVGLRCYAQFNFRLVYGNKWTMLSKLHECLILFSVAFILCIEF